MKTFLSGSECMAYGVRLSRVDVMSAYPITPNTPTLLAIYDMINEGTMETVAVNAESELGAMGICIGAESVGCRTFCCTCAQGFVLMREFLWAASGMALPVVLGITSRQVGSPQGLMSDFSDNLSERDASFLQFICENGQEVIDSLIMAYKISEDDRVLLPSLVVEEGFRLTHSFELVDVPEQEDVDKLLPRYCPKHAFVDPNYPIMQGSGSFTHYHGLKMQQYLAMQNAKEVIKEVCREFGALFGREYGLVESYKTEDAEFIVVGMGTVVSMLRQKVDEYREKGVKG
ncbi:MAG: pyruvate ferredoxin oxidoreductase [Pseudomonadota bacterium]